MTNEYPQRSNRPQNTPLPSSLKALFPFGFTPAYPLKSPKNLAQVLPDGSSGFAYVEYNSVVQPTTRVSTYGGASGVLMRTNTYAYDLATGMLLVLERGPTGHMVRSNSWNSRNQVLTTANALGETTVFTYMTNAPFLLTSVRLPNGLLTTNYYYATGQTNFLERAVIPALGITNAYTYTNCLVRTHTDERGRVVTNQYDQLRRLVATSSDNGTARVVYTNLLVAYTVNVMNHTNRFGYDAFGRKVWEADALGRTNRYEYCDCGTLGAVSNAIGQWVRYYYNNVGQVTWTLASDGFTVTNAYDVLGRLVWSRDSSGAATTNCYNHQGLVCAVSNALGRVAFSQFDIWDRVTNSVDLNGVAVRTDYDLLGRVTKTTYANGSFDALRYSSGVAVPTSATNRLGHVTRFAYDLAGRKIAETNALGHVTTYAYGVSGELLSLTDGKGNVTRWGYDKFARMTSKTNASGTRVLALAYDPLGRVTNRWTPAKGNTVYRYDPVGNLTNVDYPSSPDLTFQYDALNRLTNRLDALGTTKFTYNTSGLVESEDGPWADDTISYSYNQRRLTQAILLQPATSAWTVGYAYEAAQRLTNVMSAAGSFGYQYEVGRPGLQSRLNLPGGTYIEYGHDQMTRLTNSTCRSAAGWVLDAHTYAYDNADQVTRHTRTEGSYVDYAYDKIGQLVSATGKESDGVTNRLHERFGYAYNAAGNVSCRTNNALTQTFGVNARNELTAITRAGTYTVAGTTASGTTNLTVNFLGSALYTDLTFASPGHTLLDGTNLFTARAYGNGWAETNTTTAFLPATVSFAYDANGNLVSDGVRGYEYDDENQLIRITQTNAWKSEFVYDGANRRRLRKEYTWSGSAWVLAEEVRYVYDGQLVVQQRDGSNQPRLTFTRGLDRSGTLEGAGGIGGLLARTDHTTGTPLYVTTFFVADGAGSVSSLVSTNGLVVAHYRYDPYGGLLARFGPLAEANRYQFSSKELHAASGLICFGRRYYAPSLQRWLNQDPIQEQGGHNLYAYVGNAPVGAVDPYGEEILSDYTQPIQNEGIGAPPPVPMPKREVVGSLDEHYRYLHEQLRREVATQRILEELRHAQAPASSGGSGGGGGRPKKGASKTEGSGEKRCSPAAAFHAASDMGKALGETAYEGAAKLQEAGKYALHGREYLQGFRGNQYVSSTAVAEAKAAHASMAQMYQAVRWGGAIVGVGLAGYELWEGGGSPRSGVKALVTLGITGTAFIPVVGPFLSIGFSTANAVGGFDWLYNKVDNTPTWGKKAEGPCH